MESRSPIDDARGTPEVAVNQQRSREQPTPRTSLPVARCPFCFDIQVRIALLMGSLTVLFLVGMLVMGAAERRRNLLLAESARADREEVFDRILALAGEPLRVLAYDYTYWDEMVRFMRTRDPAWARENIDTVLTTYRVCYAGLFATDGTRVYEVGSSEAPMAAVPPAADRRRLFQSARFSHFFASTGGVLVEFRMAPIQPTADIQRTTPPRGYFIVGRTWDAARIAELSALTMSSLTVSVGGEPAAAVHDRGVHPWIIRITRTLPDWRGNPTATLTAVGSHPFLERLWRLSRGQTAWMAVFGTAAVLACAVLMYLWVNRPLRVMSAAMRLRDPGLLEGLRRERTEFGRLADLIHRFFEQQDLLEREMRHRERLQHQLLQSERFAAIGQVAGGIAHELNNPMAGILGMTQLLLADVEPGSRLHSDLKNIEQLALRCRKITAAMLEFARQKPAVFAPFDVNVVVRAALDLFRRRLEDHGILLTMNLDAALPPAAGDEQQIQIVVMNLVSNALDAMPGGGSLIVSTRTANGKIILRVEDTGVGIPEENLARVFEPFFTTKGPAHGTGLGLTLCANIIERHRGRISVESVRHHGTAFTVELPVFGAGGPS